MPVVALSQVHCKELKSVFSQKIKSWQSELFWDYQPTVALVKKQITSKSLSGYAIKTPSGEILGYSYYIVNKPVGYIGNIYILSESANPTTYAELLNRIIGILESNSSILRIEGHFFTFNCDLIPFFKARGFNTIKRHFLSKAINSKGDNEQTLVLPSKIRLVKWQNFFAPKQQKQFAIVTKTPLIMISAMTINHLKTAPASYSICLTIQAVAYLVPKPA